MAVSHLFLRTFSLAKRSTFIDLPAHRPSPNGQNRKRLQYRHQYRVLKHRIAHIEALDEAHLLRWFLGPKPREIKVFEGHQERAEVRAATSKGIFEARQRPGRFWEGQSGPRQWPGPEFGIRSGKNVDYLSQRAIHNFTLLSLV